MRTTFETDRTQWPEVWRATCQLLEEQKAITAEQARVWIHPLKYEGVEDQGGRLSVRLVAMNDFTVDWIRRSHLKALEGALGSVTGKPCEVVLAVSEAEAGPARYREEDAEAEVLGGHSGQEAGPYGSESATPGGSVLGWVTPTQVSPSTSRALAEQPDSRYVFENFVVGASNQFAHASAIAVADNPARQYNPLFIYSAPGLGKTHLLHAIGNRIIQRNPEARVAYLSAEKFVNELIESLQHRRMPQFRAKYRDSFDLILIDDIQFIAGKNSSEEEFFHTFNALYSSKRQIILTSDRPPKEIQGLEERIRTRFEWGLVADITPPEIETRIAILKSKAERDDIYLPDEVATFLATYIRSNVRELEGVLIKLQAQASLTGAEISLEMARHELRNVVPEEGAHYTVEAIQAAVAKFFHLKVVDLKSTSRARRVAMPRQIAMYLIRKYTGAGLKETGQYFGGKDHSTVIHACKAVSELVEKDPETRDTVEAIQNLL